MSVSHLRRIFGCRGLHLCDLHATGNTAGNGGRTVLAALRGFATEDGVDTDNNDRETERSESVGSMRATLGSTGRHVEDYDPEAMPLFGTEKERIEAFLKLDEEPMKRALAYAPPERLPRQLATLPKDIRRRMAAAERDAIIAYVRGGRFRGKKHLGGYAGTDWTHTVFSAPSVRYPMAFADTAYRTRDIPAGNEYLLYLEGLKTASPEAFQEVVSGVSGVALMEEPERSAERPLSGDVARVLERVVEWRVQFAMSPGSREPHPVNSAARLRVSLDDLAGALGLKEEAVRRLEMLAGKRVKGGVLTIASRGWRTREDNRRQAMEWLQRLVEEAVRGVQEGPEEKARFDFQGEAYGGMLWLPRETMEAAEMLRDKSVVQWGEGEESGASGSLEAAMRKASRVLRGVPTGLNVPRSGLVSAALLARWPREAMEALRVVARAVEGEGSEGAVKSVGEGKEKGKEKGEEMGEIGEKAWGEAWWEKEGDEVVARAAAVVARQLREDYVATEGVANDLRELEQAASKSSNPVVRLWHEVSRS